MKKIAEITRKIEGMKKLKSVYDVTDRVKYLLIHMEGLCQPEYEEMCDALDWITECLIK